MVQLPPPAPARLLHTSQRHLSSSSLPPHSSHTQTRSSPALLFRRLPQPSVQSCLSHHSPRRLIQRLRVRLLPEQESEDWDSRSSWWRRGRYRAYASSRNRHDDPCRPQRQLVQMCHAFHRIHQYRVAYYRSYSWLRDNGQVSVGVRMYAV
jgi:hypothetical protein